MQKFFQQKQSMQIAQERSHVGQPADAIDKEIDELSKHYSIHKRNEVTDFIKRHPELIAYLKRITPIISSYFPDYTKCLTFHEDYEFEGLNDITIYIKSKSTFQSDWKKLNELEIEILTLKEFPREINTLLTVDLWYHE